jgi:hypothetical protein
VRRSMPALRYALPVALALTFLWPSISGAVQPPDPNRPSKLEWMVQERIYELDQRLAGRLQKRLAPAELAELKDSGLQVDATGRMFLTFQADQQVGDQEKADLRNLGAVLGLSTADIPPFHGRSLVPPNYGAIDAWIPYDRVEAAAALSWVATVAAVETAHGDAGSVLSQGVKLHRANRAQAAGIYGSGVTVGVISTGVLGYRDAIVSGDLPKDVLILGDDPGTDGEGTAMMEIVHDMAPDAKLVFHQASGNSVISYVVALRALADSGVDVIAEDIAFDREPAFAQGPAVFATQEIAKSGIAIFGSAGNLGASHAERRRVKGTGSGPEGNSQFTDCPKPPTNVASTFSVEMSSGAPLDVTLQWSEPPAHAFTDFDLYLMDDTGSKCLAWSLGGQGGGVGAPLEHLDFTNWNPGPRRVKIVVNLADDSTAAAPPLIDLRWRTDPNHSISSVSTPFQAGSLNPNANFTALVTSVAAADAEFITDPARVQLEGFSGAGPVVLETTTVCAGGLYPCQKGVAGPTPFVGGGPSWTAADQVSVSGAGHFPKIFMGTSAAAPHAAGCAALIHQQLENEGVFPTLALIQERMERMAVSRGARADWGAGVLICYPLEN